MVKRILPMAAMEKLLKKSGAERVSYSAKEALIEVLENFSDEVGNKAVKLAKHSGRKTVKASDVKLAVK